MKRKKLPGFVTNPLLIELFQTKIGRMFTNWVLQGMLYMNPVEIIYKLGLDVVLTLIWWVVAFRSPDALAWTSALLLAHTTNWIINCQPIALRRHLDWGENDANDFICYVEGLQRRIDKCGFLLASASYGSLSLGNYKPTSDIDIRVIMRRGTLNKFRAAHFCFTERLRAAMAFFPLDLYAFSLDEAVHKMNADEPPVIFLDKEGVLASVYSNAISFGEFHKNFRTSVLSREI